MTVGEHVVAPVKCKPKPWTRVEKRKAEELYKTMSAREVAEQLGRTKQSVEARFSVSNTVVRKKTWEHWTAAEDAYLMLTDNKTAAKHLKRSVSACKSRRRKLKQLVKTAKRG